MKVTILGSGAAGGVPMVSVGWGKCDPANPRNRRRRPSVLVETDDGQTVLIDTSPDLREQLIDAGVSHLDAVFYTHAHADHVHGIDDLREVNRAMRKTLDVWGTTATLDEIAARFGYVFETLDLTKVPIYKPILIRREISGDSFQLGQQAVTCIDMDHGYGRTTGFRFGRVAYCTDVRHLTENNLRQLEGLDLWIVGCLVETLHPTHAHLPLVLDWVERLRPKRTILTHMSPMLDYDTLTRTLPSGVEAGYDGMQLFV